MQLLLLMQGGLMEYKVRLGVTQIHQVVVEANSKDEAVEVANGIDLDNWNLVSVSTDNQEVELVGEHN
jgi:hypothetical protein